MLKNQLDFIARYSAALKSFDPFISSSIKKQFIFVAILVLGVVVTNTLMIWLIGQPFNHVLQQDYSGLAETLLVLAVVITVNQFFHYQNIYRANVLALTFVGDLRNASLAHICRAKEVATDRFRKGDLLARLSDDSDMVQRFVIESPLFFISHVLTLLFYGVMLVIIDWQLAVFVLFLTPLFLLHQKFFAKPKAETSRQFLAANGTLLSKEDEILTNLRLVKAFNAIKLAVVSHKRYFADAFDWACKERRLNAAFSTTLLSIIYLCALLIVYFGIRQIEDNDITVADLVSFLIYMGYLSVPIRGIADLGYQVQADTMAGNRVLSLYDLETEAEEKEKTWHAKHGKIQFENLSYQIDSKKILNSINLTLDAGQSYAIVGESGVGKSTFAQLLLGFVSPSQGTISIDGTLLSALNKYDLRESVSIVWQQPLLFDDSIRMNMLLAKQDATEDEVANALKMANAKDFVTELPNGIDTEIGNHGVQLSGGQRQRLHIAQAILRNPDIMILDEATSALDSVAEEQVITNLKQIREGRTTIIITHRYSAIKHVDQIIYLNTDGTATLGTHDHLVKTHEGYQHAIRWQTQE